MGSGSGGSADNGSGGTAGNSGSGGSAGTTGSGSSDSMGAPSANAGPAVSSVDANPGSGAPATGQAGAAASPTSSDTPAGGLAANNSQPDMAAQTAPPAGANSGPGAPSGDLEGTNSTPVAQQSTADLLQLDQYGSNVVFVLDSSLSMGGNDKSTAARQKLINALQNLGTNKSFSIVFFPNTTMPAQALLPAVQSNIDLMTNWIFTTTSTNSLASDSDQAVLQALKFKPDTVWLLSNGALSTNALQRIHTANDPVHASINAMDFYSSDGAAVLRKLADENNGTYQLVPPPAPASTAP